MHAALRLKNRSRVVEQFLTDRDAQDVACYRLLIAIEAALALCYHVSAKRLKRVPEEYAQCFRLLYEDGLIPQDLMQNLQHMARFRNFARSYVLENSL